MARNLGNILANWRGKIGGIVSSRNSSGEIIRSYVVPTDANTQAQQNRRSIFSQVSAYWNSLSLASKQGWNSFANNGFVPKGGRRAGTYSGFLALSSLWNVLAGASDKLTDTDFNPGTIVADFAGITTFQVTTPDINLTNQIVDGDGNPLVVMLEDCDIYDDGSYSMTFTFDRTSGSDPVVFRTPDGVHAIGFLLYVSASLRNNIGAIPSPERFFVAFTGFPTISSGWSDTDTFTLEGTQLGTYISQLKGWPSAGQTVRQSVYIVANTGQVKKLGVIQKEMATGPV